MPQESPPGNTGSRPLFLMRTLCQPGGIGSLISKEWHGFPHTDSPPPQLPYGSECVRFQFLAATYTRPLTRICVTPGSLVSVFTPPSGPFPHRTRDAPLSTEGYEAAPGPADGG